MSGERADIPSVSVMTEKFITAAQLMATTLRAPDHPFVVIPHPISSADPEALAAAARTATAACVELLTGQSPRRPGDPRSPTL